MLTIPASAKHTATVLFLHGLGDTESGWAPAVAVLAKSLPHVKWMLPTAPMQPVSLAQGLPMNSWFDIKTLNDVAQDEDAAGMLKSRRFVQDVIDEESKTIDPQRIVVGGFSQGCAVSILSGVLCPQNLGGIIALSGWLPMRARIVQERKEAFRTDLPVFWGHGTADAVVPFAYGQRSVDHLQKEWHFSDVTFQAYPHMGHASCPEEISHITAWLKQRLP